MSLGQDPGADRYWQNRRKARRQQIAYVAFCMVLVGLGLLLAANALANMALRADCPCSDVDLVQ